MPTHAELSANGRTTGANTAGYGRSMLRFGATRSSTSSRENTAARTIRTIWPGAAFGAISRNRRISPELTARLERPSLFSTRARRPGAEHFAYHGGDHRTDTYGPSDGRRAQHERATPAPTASGTSGHRRTRLTGCRRTGRAAGTLQDRRQLSDSGIPGCSEQLSR